MKQVTVLGEGAWGTAVATLLAHKGYSVKLWCYDQEVAQQIVKNHVNEKYLPGVTLSSLIVPTCDISEALCGSEFVFEAVPVPFLRGVLEQAKPCFDQSQTWIVLSKGIEQNTLMFSSQIIDDVFACDVQKMVLMGPSFAADVARKSITAVVIAAQDCKQGERLQSILACEYFRPYLSTDVIGVQIAAALKNVITLGVGMLEGAGYTDNAKAFFITRGLSELSELTHVLGGKQETVYGLAGVGDLVLTATGTLSKNLRVGNLLGQGKSLDTLTQEMGTVPEGINTVQSAMQLMQKKPKLKLPICRGVYEVIFQKKMVTQMMHELMNQPLSYECV